MTELELQVERQRQRLVTCHRDFEPYAAFRRMDINNDQKLDAFEIYNFLRDNDPSSLYTIRDCQLIISYFDLDHDEGLSYSEFLLFLLPCDDLFLRS